MIGEKAQAFDGPCGRMSVIVCKATGRAYISSCDDAGARQQWCQVTAAQTRGSSETPLSIINTVFYNIKEHGIDKDTAVQEKDNILATLGQGGDHGCVALRSE